ncbi:hypothetical protein [Sanyastnella coralliicola]|uniref:hypothetical protein n=1 Tax=Sanyastnella coralliicola TaxID=3069118 RepID=UPI0027B89A0A|nr:hypothetical protein [Longitalea sp. SCSIO 12813]
MSDLLDEQEITTEISPSLREAMISSVIMRGMIFILIGVALAVSITLMLSRKGSFSNLLQNEKGMILGIIVGLIFCVLVVVRLVARWVAYEQLASIFAGLIFAFATLLLAHTFGYLGYEAQHLNDPPPDHGQIHLFELDYQSTLFLTMLIGGPPALVLGLIFGIGIKRRRVVLFGR